MNVQPANLRELIEAWKQDLARLNESNSETVAYDMVGRLAGNDLWDELCEGLPARGNPLVAEVFDLVADLELPPHVYKTDRSKASPARPQTGRTA